MTPPEVPYRRDVLIEVIVYHQRRDIVGCACGWAVLGASHPEHVATVYEESVRHREAGSTDPRCEVCGAELADGSQEIRDLHYAYAHPRQ